MSIPGRTLPVWQGGLIVLLVCLAYLPALHGDFIWDDDTYISLNGALRSGSGLWDIWFQPGATCQYYPLSFTVFWADYHLWGLNPPGYHLQNLLLHGLVAVLLWQVLKQLEVRAAWLAGAIFALHPVNVMSVAWMTELKNTLSGALALGAVWAYLRFAGLGVYATGPPPGKDGRYGLLSLGLFLLAMLAKTAVSFLPVTLLLLLWWKGGPFAWRRIWPVPVMLGIVLGMGLVTLQIEQLYGATGDAFRPGPFERILISGRSFWFYLGKLFFPYPLTFIYERWAVDASDWRQYGYPAALLGLLGGLWRLRKRIGRGAFVALLHFYIATSLLVLMQVLYMMRFTFVADHWQYFGCMSVVALAAAGLDQAFDWLRPGQVAWKRAGGGVLLLALGVLTWRQCGMYADLETLWTTTLARNPTCWMAQNNLGLLLRNQGRIDEAMEHYHKAIRINPNFAEARANIGSVLAAEGRYDEAIEYDRQAIRIKPNSFEALNNLGIALSAKGRLDEAIENYFRAIQINPTYYYAPYNLGNALFTKRRFDEAIKYYREAIRAKPDYYDALNNLGIALAAKGRFDEAVDAYRQAIQINPDSYEVFGNLGDALAAEGRLDEAIANYRRAIQINPNRPEIFFHLGMVLGRAERNHEAVVQYREALRLNPDLAGGLNNLAWLLATCPDDELRNGPEAVRLAEHACELTHYGEPLFIGTLAAAYAEAGRYAEAVTTAEKAEQLATRAGLTAVAVRNRQLLELYRSARPYHETASADH